MTRHTVTLIPGDGIGVETSAAMQRIVEACGAEIDWEIAEAGAHCLETEGTPLPDSTIEAVKRNKVAIKGPITTPVGTGFRSVNVALRKTLGLYVCLRPVVSLPGAGGRYDNVDLVIVRENSEDLYAGVEFEEGSEGARKLIGLCAKEGAGTIRPDSGISVKPISVTASQDIVRYAFEYALKHGRKKVTAAHKANIMKYSDGLFLRVAREVAKEYEGRVDFDDRIIDAFCMNMVTDPSQFDVVVFPNLYGDSGPCRRLGYCPGCEYRQRICRVRGGSWLCSQYRGAEQGEPHGGDSLCRDDARPSRRARSCGPYSSRGHRSLRRWRMPDGRYS